MMNHMMNILILGITAGILCHSASAKRGGFVQTSYFSTDGGGFASGAAESSVIGPDGIRKGECSYTNSNGESFKIKYEEKSNGQIIKGSVNGKEGKQDIERALGECRGSLTKLSGSVQEELEGTKERIAEIDRTFQRQMDSFNRQQESFISQQTNFFQQMADFSKRLAWKK
ncbi:uncharacterized protein LOC135201408 isoform X2 [Macrobrachium nipponense]|uniref:uncharacterized protein LOC135201408 isoform X2 n=1 Tax=Macrobrachium nipponense TaxID=159736 RepID=UPI0030C81E61